MNELPITFLFIGLILAACTEKIEAPTYQNSVKLELVDSLVLDLGKQSTTTFNSIEVFSQGQEDYIFFFDWLRQVISVYHLQSQSLDKKIFLQSEGPSGLGDLDIENSSILVESLNSIYLHNQQFRKIHRIDSTGRVHEYYNVSLRDDDTEPFASMNNPMLSIGKNLFFPTRSDFDDNMTNRFAVMKFDLEIKNMHFGCNYPKVFNDYNFSMHNYFYEANLTRFKGDLLVSFPSIPDMFIYNSDLKIEFVKLVIDEDIGYPDSYTGSKDPDGDFGAHNRYWRSTDVYGRVFNLNDDYFIRQIIDRPSREEYANRVRRTPNYRYLIMDSELDVIGRSKLSGHERKYSHRMTFVDSKGLFYVFNQDEFIKDEDRMRFDVFKLIAK